MTAAADAAVAACAEEEADEAADEVNDEAVSDEVISAECSAAIVRRNSAGGCGLARNACWHARHSSRHWKEAKSADNNKIAKGR